MCNKSTNAKQVSCARCGGTGQYTWMTYWGIDGGVCFRCSGSGIDPNPVYAERKAVQTAEQKARAAAQIADVEKRKAINKEREELETGIAHKTSSLELCLKQEKAYEDEGQPELAQIMRDAAEEHAATIDELKMQLAGHKAKYANAKAESGIQEAYA